MHIFRTALLLLACAMATAGTVPNVAMADGPAIPHRAYAYQRLLVRCAHASPWGLSAPVAVLAAQVHAESLWNPAAESWCGASGLAQFMPKTAVWLSSLRGLGDAMPQNPGWALRAMAEYDYHLHSRAKGADDCNRWAFALSGYNGGEGWRKRDQRLATEQGLDPLVWWGSVETVNAGRSKAAWKENRDYPRRILLLLTPLYEAAGWGGGVCGHH